MEQNNLKFDQRPDIDTRYQLDLLCRNLEDIAYPDYPSFKDRLVISPIDIGLTTTGNLILPDGPWTINTHPNRSDSEAVPRFHDQQRLISQGLSLDTNGRPLHPWILEMVEDLGIGVVTGKGFYRKWGPNYTVDSIIIHQEQLLLVKRLDTEGTDMWALPGGFIDPGETALIAGPREVQEETSIILPDNVIPKEVYVGPVADFRLTANAWPETTALLYDVVNPFAIRGYPLSSNETKKSAWIPLDIVLKDIYLFGSHRHLLNEALRRL